MSQFATEETEISTNSTSSSFFTNVLPRCSNETTIWDQSVDLSNKSIERNKRDHYKGNDPNPHPCLCENALGWDLKSCNRCYKDLGLIRFAEETRQEEKAQEEDRIQAKKQPHVDRIHNLGIHLDSLVEFAYKHDCWLWPTYKVVRDIIVPATSETRCRYGDLPEIQEIVLVQQLYYESLLGC